MSRMDFRRCSLLRVAAAIGMMGLAACAVIDPVDDPAELVHRCNSQYNNTATLLNIVRASLFEPLSFSSVSGFAAHNTVSGSLGAPTATFAASSLQSLVSGSSSAMQTTSNDYSININDDGTFYRPLLIP